MNVQDLITLLQDDPDMPPGVVFTPLPDSKLNARRDADVTADQWQIAVDIHSPVDDILDQIVTQHERAADRLRIHALRVERVRQTQLLQDEFRVGVETITEAQKQRLKDKRDAIKTRHPKGKADA